MHKRFIMIIVFIIIVSGCNNLIQDNTILVSSSYEKDIENLIKKNIKEYQLDNFDIKNILNKNNYIFVQFLVNNKNNTLNEGLAYIEKQENIYKLIEIDIAETDLNIPFTNHTLGVIMSDGRNCKLIGGYINNKDIKEIHIEYKNNTVKIIKIGDNQKTFLEYIIGDLESIVAITGYNKNHDIIYKYNYVV